MPQARLATPVRICVSLLMTLALVVGFYPSTEKSQAARRRWSFKRVERCMMERINRKRVRHGRSRLAWDRQLGYVARLHARKMARRRAIFHDSNLGDKITRWTRLADNVGAGRTCRRLFKAFWRSGPHRDNILGPYRYMGVGSKRDGGQLFVHQIFEARRDPGNVYSAP